MYLACIDSLFRILLLLKKKIIIISCGFECCRNQYYCIGFILMDVLCIGILHFSHAQCHSWKTICAKNKGIASGNKAV